MLTKIKHSKGETEIWWKDENDRNGESIEHKLVCSEAPRPELFAALQSFVGYVLDICGLPGDYSEGLTVTGVSISESDHMGTGIVVTSLKKVIKANSPVVINTPHLSRDASSEGGPSWPAYVNGLMARLEEEAMLYRSGKRSQGELPLETVAHEMSQLADSMGNDAEVEAYLRAHLNDDPLRWPKGSTPEQCERILSQIQAS